MSQSQSKSQSKSQSESMAEQEIESAASMIKQEIKTYIENRKRDKQNLTNRLSKDEMADIIFKQNDLLSQQSSQMLDIINMANVIEQTARSDESSKCNIVKDQNEKYSQLAGMQKQYMSTYESSFRVQIILFILFLVVVAWLIYHYTYPTTTKNLI